MLAYPQANFLFIITWPEPNEENEKIKNPGRISENSVGKIRFGQNKVHLACECQREVDVYVSQQWNG